MFPGVAFFKSFNSKHGQYIGVIVCFYIFCSANLKKSPFNQDFLIIQQNAASLCSGHPELFQAIDAIVQEGIWFERKKDVLKLTDVTSDGLE